jgi:glycosyltransferase involved in cell wall biosynthesis
MYDQVTNQKILAVIPAYNEQNAIAQVVKEVKAIIPRADILVIDDGSKDRTAQRAQAAGALVVRHPINLGIGGTVQTGLKFAHEMGYPFIVRLDGDGQHNSEDIPKLLNPVIAGHADVAIGSRFINNEKQDMHVPFVRRIGIRFFAAEVSLITKQRATDTTSGFVALNGRAAKVLANCLPQDYPEVEGRVILHKAGLTTKEIPVRMRERVAGVSSIDSWRSIYYSLKVSLAVLMTAFKEVPTLVEDVPYASTNRAKSDSHFLQPGHFASDILFDSKAKAS